MKNNFKLISKLISSYRGLFFVYLFVLLISSCLYAYIPFVDAQSTVYVGSETALRDAVTNAVGPTVIVFTADIQLTGTPLNIVAGKDIVLTSNSSGVFFRLIGVSGQVTITVAFGGVLELAGITVTHASGASGRGVNIDVGGSLILTDGTISRNTAPGTLSASGGGVYNDGGNFTMFGGVVSNNTAAGTISGYGGGIYIIDGNFTMFGGVVSNNTATSGGGIYNSDSNFTMSGGTIANNTARGTSNGYGGGIYSRGGPFTMFNGTIANNTAGWGGGGIYSIYSSVTVFNGTMSNNNAGTSGGGVCTAGGNFTMTGGTIANNNPTRQGGGIYNENGNVTMYSGAITNNTALVGGGIYNSYGNVTMSGGAITNNTASEYVGGGIYNEGGNVTMLDGTIANNTAVDGGGVHSRNGDFTMSGGAIANNTATNGGGVTNYGNYNSAQFTMCGGVIANNTASVGGGIYNGGISTIFNVYYVNLTMCGGVIANNTASEGGGIYNDGYGNITMSGGAITNNTAEYGGGIYSGGNVTMFGGTIANNTANQGGGIYSGGNVTMFGGTIANNTADYGGGIHNIYGNVTMSNGTIVNNTAKIYGGGIYNNIGSFTMSGGTIVNSTAFVGGGINNSDGSFTMSGGTIVNSTAFVGGGIYNADSNFTMSGGTIVNSTAYIGGGIYNSDGNVTMSNGTIANNTATNGGGIYLASGLVTLFGGMVVDNSAIVDGGGVWVAHQDLNKLFVYDGVIFSNNSASIAYNRDPADDATYYAQIGSNVVWTTPFTQGYNNYDISYTNGTPYILYTVTVNDSYAPITGAGDYQAGENVTINAGIRPGYTFINWTVNEGNITLPSTPTATFTMPEGNVVVTANWQADQTLTGMISVTKLTNPPNSETIFNFVTSAPQEAFNLIDGAVWDSGNLTIGTYTITELAQAGWNLTDIIVEGTPNYTIDLSSGTATLTLEAGQHLNLTYLNNNQETSSITVNKVTTGVSSGGSEVFYFVVSSGEFFNLTADASWNSGSLPPGTYTVTEWQGPWNVTDIQVTGTPNYSVDLDNRTVTFTLELGQHINITFTDNLLGVPKPVLMSFRADKVTVPLGAEAIFDFVPSFGAPFSLGDGDYLVRMITNLGLYSVTELMQPGWVLSDIIVEGTPNYLVDLDAGTVLFNPLYSGNPVFVTFVNEELAGSVTVLKQTLPLGALTQFNFTTTAPGGSFTLADGETWSSGNLSSGTYVISELAVAGWDLVDIVVQGASNYTVDLAVGSLVLYLGAGESVFVTFINGEQERPLFGSISVIKAAYPSDTQTVFTFVTSVSGGIFTLVDGAVWDSGSLAPGDYVVTELGVAGWDLTNIIVLDPTNNSYVDLASRSVFIVLDPGETISILYQNTQQASQMGSINVVKATCPADAQDVFSFVTSISPGTFSLTDGATWSSGPLVPGNYTVTEFGVAGWDLASIIIDDPTNNSRVDLVTRTAFIALDPGETITILYQNSQQAPDQGSFSVTKVTCPVDSFDMFSFVTSAPGGSFSLTDGQSWSSGMLAPGTYTVTELVPPGWEITNILLNDPSGTSTVDLSTGTAIINLQAGTHVSIVYQDAQAPPPGSSISVVKAACPTDTSAKFTFVSSASQSAFSLGDGEVWSSGELVPGRYFVTEVLQAGWVISDIVVVDPSGTSNVDLLTGTAFINLQAGTHVTILYQNTEQLHPDCCNKDPCQCNPCGGCYQKPCQCKPCS